MIFTTWEKFAETVGVLTPKQLKRIPQLKRKGIKWDDRGSFDIGQSDALRTFVRDNPSYHIVTETSDFDDFEFGGYTVSNRWRYVNRLAYYLANGSDDDSHELVEEYEEGEFDSCEEDAEFRRSP